MYEITCVRCECEGVTPAWPFESFCNKCVTDDDLWGRLKVMQNNLASARQAAFAECANIVSVSGSNCDKPAVTTALLIIQDAIERAAPLPPTHVCVHRVGESLPMLGGTYQTQSGETVKMVAIANIGMPHETLIDEQGRHRYSRRTSDMGRLTGTAHDYSDSGNLKRPISPLKLTRVEANFSAKAMLAAHEGGGE